MQYESMNIYTVYSLYLNSYLLEVTREVDVGNVTRGKRRRLAIANRSLARDRALEVNSPERNQEKLRV